MPDSKESNFPLELFDPKSVFYRVHADRKLYHYLNSCVVNRGVVVKSLDMRHLKIRRRNELNFESIERFANEKSKINKDQFGFDCIDLCYSLSKRKRWELADYFEQNAENFQFPEQKSHTVLATSEFPFQDLWRSTPLLFENYYSGSGDSRHVKRLITCDHRNGQVNIMENRNSRGFALNYLKPFPIGNDKYAKGVSRKLTKRQRRINEENRLFQNLNPIRIAYYLVYPPRNKTFSFINDSKESGWNHNSLTYCRKAYGPSWCRSSKKSYKVNFSKLDPKYDDFNYFSDSNDNDEVTFNESDAILDQSEYMPKPMILVDFMEDQLLALLDNEFLTTNIHQNFSLEDYDFCDL